MSREELRRLRWRHVSLVFQSAMNVAQPGHARGRPVRRHVQGPRSHVRKSDALPAPATCSSWSASTRTRLRSYPHELSGGMRQRVVIAMALALEPELIVMDEPTTALDVVVQREILQEIEELKERLGFAVLFITHDLSLLRRVQRPDRDHVRGRDRRVRGLGRALPARRCTRTRSGLMSSFPPLTGRSCRSRASRARRPISRSRRRLPLPPALPAVHAASTATCTAADAVRPLLREIEPGHQVACHSVEGTMSTLEVQRSASSSRCAGSGLHARDAATPSRTCRSRCGPDT